MKNWSLFLNTKFGWGVVAILPTVLTDLIENIFKLLTLGYYTPSITLKWLLFINLYKIKINQKHGNK